MALTNSKSKGLRAANKIVLDDAGFALGTVTSVAYGEWEPIKRGKSELSERSERIEIAVSVNGTQSPININIYASLILNESYTTVGKGKHAIREYNRITTMALALGFVTESELVNLTEKQISDISDRFDALKDKHVTFKMTTLEGKALQLPDLSSMRIIASD